MSDISEYASGLDVGQEQLGAIYGKALLGATAETGTSGQVLDELESFVVDVLAKLPDFHQLLISPRVPTEQKLLILDRALKSRMSDELLTFLKVVCQRERLSCLREIARQARKQYNEMLGVIQVKVTSASPIGADLTGLIETVLRGVLRTEIVVDYSTDPDLIGGMVIRAGDTVFDGSVINRLERLRSKSLERSFQATIGVLDRFTQESE